jgi:hypothetical protein
VVRNAATGMETLVPVEPVTIPAGGTFRLVMRGQPS